MRFTFKKEERLYGHAALNNVYNKGKRVQTDSIKVIYIEVPTSDKPPCRVVFSVPKRSFKKAVDRNLIKRRMREIYRNHKHLLYNYLNEKEKSIHLYIIYRSRQIISFDELKESLLKALKIVANKLN
ncbi:MAG TPA: ribonuclease P protein component [Bacteroidia bacterium]